MPAAHEITLPTGSPPSDPSEGSIVFIGNATVLIRYAGFTILTDPTFIHMHEQVPIGYGMHTTRLTNPALDIAQLPPLDLIVLSHFHGDHFDQIAERDLDHSLPIVTVAEAATELNQRGFNNTYALETWQSFTATRGDARLRITATPGRHGPPLAEIVLPDVMGSLLEFESAAAAPPYRLYITGDTLIFDDIREIPRRYPDIDLALLHLGGTRVMGLLVTMDAEQGIDMLRTVNPQHAIPIHYNDYDVFKSPLSDFQRAVEQIGWTDRVTYLSHGDTYHFGSPQQRAR